jgi:predicted AlkP superfamily phosphohydrolase/phosphomutase
MRPVVFLGFDACDPDIVRAMAAAGKLPAFRDLLGSSGMARIQNPYALFVGTLWPSFFTAMAAGKLGFHCWEAISPQTYERRLTSPREIGAQPFWRALSRAGRRVAVIDVPHTSGEDGHNGVEVVEYGCHDRHFGFHTSPPELRSEILGRIGPHTMLTLDPDAERQFAPDDYVHRAGARRTAAEMRRFLADLLDGLDRKLRLTTWLHGREPWDLFLAVFGESHAIGHQAWHLHDPSHPWHDAHLVREIGDPIERVYAGLDRALAAHLAMVPEDAILLVLCSHGIGPHHDGTHLLEDILDRLDAVRKGRGEVRMAASSVATALRALAGRPRPHAADVDIGPRARSRRDFYLAPNNFVFSGVRINLEGRELAGRVRPGAELEAVLEELRRDLLDLVDVRTGARVVRAVERSDARHLRQAGDELPDLFIDWNHDAPIETVWSRKVGLLHRRYGHWRSGDHRPDGLLLARGPGLRERRDLGELVIADLGATICDLLGAPLVGVDGRTAPALDLSSP